MRLYKALKGSIRGSKGLYKVIRPQRPNKGYKAIYGPTGGPEERYRRVLQAYI